MRLDGPRAIARARCPWHPALAGDIARIGLYVLFWIGALGASLPIPRVKGHPAGAWVAAPFHFRGPLLAFSPGLQRVLEKEELTAIIAHEMHHLTWADRVSRFAAGLIGGCTAPVVALVLLRTGGPATLAKLGVVLAASAVGAIMQSRMLQQSERRADATAAELVGSAEVVKRAHAKIRRANREVWGLGAEEIGRSRDELYSKYLADLGGLQAVPRRQPRLDEIDRTTDEHTLQVLIERESVLLQLSVGGEFIISLVDGRRTVEAILKQAQTERGFTEFEVCRALHQLKSGDLITT
ncbi:MAG: M48 family metalloprotease [Planctomycetia bacterium]|nr:M48 family metalloprotease [Planctomycetia bacterium]